MEFFTTVFLSFAVFLTIVNSSLPKHLDQYWDGMPNNWTSMNNTFLAVILDPSDGVYQAISSIFEHYFPGRVIFKKIERIQNKTLHDQYVVLKKHMDSHNTVGIDNETRLWHGTSRDAIDKINHNGFNRSYCGKNATVYGNGVYFDEELSYSAQDVYSRQDSNGHKRVYLCKVLVGDFAQGRPGIIDPPSKFGQHENHILCDSVVDDIKNPKIFVIFKDSQAYPEYLIEFKFI